MNDKVSGTQEGITLGVLTAVESNAAVTQRVLAKQLGIALGLANTYFRKCVKKGLIKVQLAPANRYAYYLTPMGFAEKSRLTAFYLSQSFHFFRVARTESADLIQTCSTRNWRRIVLYGASDFAEIMTLCARDFPIELVGIVDEKIGALSYAALPVRPSIADFPDVDAIIVCELNEPQDAFDAARTQFKLNRVLAPRFLNVSLDIHPDGAAQ